MVTTITGFQDGYTWTGNSSDNVLENQGFVSGATALTTFDFFSNAALTLRNLGAISAQDSGIAIRLGAPLAEPVTHSIINSGSIIGGVVSFDTGMSLTNSGVMFGLIDGSDRTSNITNSGVISYKNLSAQPLYAGLPANGVIVLGSDDDTVTNTGTITGNIHLGTGNNTFDGRGGTLVGSVFGGTGNDVYRLSAATSITDTGGIDRIEARFTHSLGSDFENLRLLGFGNFSGTGNGLNNEITGNASRNKLLGLLGDDTLSGGGGADSLFGGVGNDVMFGGSGDDRLSGAGGADSAEGGIGNDIIETDAGNDTLRGGDGNDRLDGGTGADLLDGGAGDDRLIGGAFGTDTMTGGTGADHFIYLTSNDSFNTSAADVITDFEIGFDKIDLSALSDSAFQFLGNAPFVPTGLDGLPSVRVTQEINGTTVVQVELTGDTFADLRVVLTGTLALTAGDFLL